MLGGMCSRRRKDFEEDLLVVDFPDESGNRAARRSTLTQPRKCRKLADETWILRRSAKISRDAIESLYKALVLGLRDYVNKCGFKSVVLGLSGGIDSALTAALGRRGLRQGSSGRSRDAEPTIARAAPWRMRETLPANLGIEFQVIPIGRPTMRYEQMLAKPFAGREPDVAEENCRRACAEPC